MNKIRLFIVGIFSLLSLFIVFVPKVFASTDLTNSWSALQSLPNARASHGLLDLNNKLFLFAGANFDDFSSILISTPNGSSISNWSLSGDIPETRYWASVVNSGESIYIIGGSKFESGVTYYLDTVYRAKVKPDNTFTSWTVTSALPTNRSLGAALVVEDRIFFSGGFNNSGTSDKVYSAPINPDGTLGSWIEAGAMPGPRFGHGMIEYNGHLIVLGGYSGTSYQNGVYKASINSDGTITGFVATTPLPEALYRAGMVKIESQIYTVGGSNGSTELKKIYYADLEHDGTIASWNLSGNELPLAISAGAVVAVKDYLYITGGFRGGSYLSSVYGTKLNISTEPDLDVPLLKQNNPLWGSQTYNSANLWSPGKTGIERWGCAMTSAAMVFNYHGITKLPDGQILDPGTLNTWLKIQKDGYIGEGLVNWNALSRLSKIAKSQNPQFLFDALENNRIAGNMQDVVKQDLENNIPDILEVAEGSTGGQHFVVGKGVEGGKIVIHDPFFTRTDLFSYGNEFVSLRRFTPSNTDLSGLLLVASEGVVISVKDKNGNEVGEGYLQKPIHDDLGEEENPKSFYIYEFNKPGSGDYTIEISSDSVREYTLKQYIYDVDGRVKIFENSGIVDGNTVDGFQMFYDKDDSSVSNVKQDVTFASLLTDLNLLYGKGEVSNVGIYITLKENILVSEQLLSVSKAASIAHLKNVLKILKSQKKKFVSEQAYEILTPQVQKLLSSL